MKTLRYLGAYSRTRGAPCGGHGGFAQAGGKEPRQVVSLGLGTAEALRRIDGAVLGGDAGATAHLLGQHSATLGSMFAVVLLDASIIGAAAVALSTRYAFGDVFGLKHSLH